MKKYSGVYAALMTPFKADSTINYSALEALIEHNIASGLHGLYVGGSTGESMLMSESERCDIFKFTAEVANGRTALFAHVGAISTDSAVRMASIAAECGYNAISAIAPFYYGFSKNEIAEYYKTLMNCSELPLIMYNFPNANGFNGMLDVVDSLIDNSKLIGIKHTSQNLFEIDMFKRLKRDLFVFNGYDEVLLGGLSMGADGGIGSTYNFMPEIILDIYNSFLSGDLKAAQSAQSKACRIIEMMLPYGVFQMEKEILTLMGIPMGECRKPFSSLNADGKEAAEEIVEIIK